MEIADRDQHVHGVFQKMTEGPSNEANRHWVHNRLKEVVLLVAGARSAESLVKRHRAHNLHGIRGRQDKPWMRNPSQAAT